MTDPIPGDDGTRVYAAHSTDGAVRELTTDDLTALRSLTIGNVSLEPTGVQVIDDILHALMWASLAQFNTDEWDMPLPTKYGPLREDENWRDLIQSLADDGADEIRKALLR